MKTFAILHFATQKKIPAEEKYFYKLIQRLSLLEISYKIQLKLKMEAKKMFVPHRIVKYTTDGDPIKIGGGKKNVIEEVETEESEGSKIDEETLNTMLAEIAAKEQRAIEKLKDADVQANILKQQAQTERDKIIADAKKDATVILEDAKKEGMEKGIKEGRETGEEKIQKELEEIIRQANAKAEKTLQDAKELTAEYFVRAEDDIVAVVMMAIEKILPQHFLDVPQTVLPVVREAIKYVRDQKEIKVHVEPESYDLILMARSEFQSMLTDGTAVLEVVSDETLKPGDCVIETPNGGVDARLLTQIELMKNSIQSVLSK